MCFVTFARSRDHYAAVARKLVRVCKLLASGLSVWTKYAGEWQGVNFSAMESAKQLQVLDHFQAPESDPMSIYEALEAVCRSEATERPVSIVIDDLSALKWSAGVPEVHQFMRCCKTLTHSTNVRQQSYHLHWETVSHLFDGQGAANVVVLSHADTDPPSGASSLFQPLVSRPHHAVPHVVFRRLLRSLSCRV